MQPRLADFKLLVFQGQLQQYRQVFVQYKIDGHDRAQENTLTHVSIARGSARGKYTWYFSAHDRFDYLLYQFEYLNRSEGTPSTEFFFLPEKVLPDSFYNTTDIEADFSIPAFQPYRILVDNAGQWVKGINEIVQKDPHPRGTGPRPVRLVDGDASTVSNDNGETVKIGSLPVRHLTENGQNFHQKFFLAIMTHCTMKRSGLLVVQSRSHPAGDFGFCRYRWTEEEQDAFLVSSRPPRTISSLCAHTPLVPCSIYSREREGTFRGPSLTSAEIRRLNSCPLNWILVFDIFGQEGRDYYSPLLIVPSDDIALTAKQQALHESNLAKGHGEFTDRVPLLAELLQSGHAISDYAVSTSGPLIFDNSGIQWEDVWELLKQFASVAPFQYPRKHQRIPDRYHATLQELHQRLIKEHSKVETHQRIIEAQELEARASNSHEDDI